jgi:hypothetical protein
MIIELLFNCSLQQLSSKEWNEARIVMCLGGNIKTVISATLKYFANVSPWGDNCSLSPLNLKLPEGYTAI